MGKDTFKNIDLTDISKMNFSGTVNMVSGIQAQMEKNDRELQQAAQEAYDTRQRMQRAMEQTAANTAETNVQLQKVVENQNEYIDMLKDQLSMQKQQLEFDEQQLTILKNIFDSGESGVVIEKEILNLIQEQIDSSHPLWDYVKDKGGDVAVAGVVAGAPVIYNAFKMYLASKGILLP